jgi:hypothetical protein
MGNPEMQSMSQFPNPTSAIDSANLLEIRENIAPLIKVSRSEDDNHVIAVACIRYKLRKIRVDICAWLLP